MSDRRWTAAEIATFAKLWNDGVSIQDCANQLKRTYHGIEKARARFNLPARDGKKRGHTVGVKWGNPLLVSKSGPPLGELGKAMKRETDGQARLWAQLLAEARA